jgi:formylglycine-generating enzyme required for sulfatase activity
MKVNEKIQSGNCVGERMTLIINNIEYAFRWCPAGTFIMGSPQSEKDEWDLSDLYDETQHQVTLSRGFWMQETEVTQEQWESMMGNNPSKYKGSQLPVETVSWNDCQDYIRRLNALISSDYQFSLPTEAQWEYACRAGSTTTYCCGDSQEQLKDYAWFGMKFLEFDKEALEWKAYGSTNPVGLKKANDWGLYDMHGNVWEWCSDLYGDYPVGNVTDPTGVNNGCSCVNRGGSWFSSAKNCRSSDRYASIVTTFKYDHLGLRCALVEKSK